MGLCAFVSSFPLWDAVNLYSQDRHRCWGNQVAAGGLGVAVSSRINSFLSSEEATDPTQPVPNLFSCLSYSKTKHWKPSSFPSSPTCANNKDQSNWEHTHPVKVSPHPQKLEPTRTEVLNQLLFTEVFTKHLFWLIEMGWKGAIGAYSYADELAQILWTQPARYSKSGPPLQRAWKPAWIQIWSNFNSLQKL